MFFLFLILLMFFCSVYVKPSHFRFLLPFPPFPCLLFNDIADCDRVCIACVCVCVCVGDSADDGEETEIDVQEMSLARPEPGCAATGTCAAAVAKALELYSEEIADLGSSGGCPVRLTFRDPDGAAYALGPETPYARLWEAAAEITVALPL
jgi:hypothetical protein